MLPIYRFQDAANTSDIDSPTHLGRRTIRRLTAWRAASVLPPPLARPAPGVTGQQWHFRILELDGDHGPEPLLQYAWEVANDTDAEIPLAGQLCLKPHQGGAAEAPFAFRLPPHWQGHLLAIVPVSADLVTSGLAEIGARPAP